jgi:hypothetical protein
MSEELKKGLGSYTRAELKQCVKKALQEASRQCMLFGKRAKDPEAEKHYEYISKLILALDASQFLPPPKVSPNPSVDKKIK